MAFDLAFTDSIGDIFTPVTDTFTRTVANGWGTADSGHAWTTSGGSVSDYSVGSGKGSVSHAAVGVAHFTTVGSALADVDITTEATVPVTALGGSIYMVVLARYADVDNYYRVELEHTTAGLINLRLQKVVATVVTSLATSLSHMSYTPGAATKLRFQIVGSTLRCRIWTGTEPSVWHLSATDATFTSGPVGTRTILSSANTNTLPVVVSYDNFAAAPVTQVRLDLNNDTPWRTLAEGTDFGTPPLKRAVAGTLLQDGERIPAAAYSNRTLTLTLDCQEPTFDAAATAFQALSRELDRPANFLRYQPGTTAPVFFRTFRSDLQSVVWDPFLRRAIVSIPAEPFAHGLREQLSAVTVTNDPAAGSNGMFFDVTGIKGDVETPLVMTITRTALFAGALASAYGVRRRGTPAAMPLVLQCESMSLGTDTTLPGNDPLMSGAGSNYARVSFATQSVMTSRLTVSLFPLTGSVDVRGAYRVFLRHRQSVGTDQMSVRLTYGASDGVGANVINDTVALTSNANRRWTDLGRVSFPFGPDPVYDGYSGIEIAVRGLSFTLDAQRVSGTGALDLDALLFVPADDRFGTIGWRTEALGADFFVLDSIADAVYALESGGEIRSITGPITRTAGTPMVSPGVTNRIVWMINAGPDNQPDTLTDTTSITASYFPRYLSVRPAST